MANHLLQSTVFALAAWLLTYAMRHERAAVRHGIWSAASVKFLVPFAPLVTAGEAAGQWLSRFLPARTLSVMVHVVPSSDGALLQTFPLVRSSVESAVPSWWLLLAAIWATGSAIVLVRWATAWRAVGRLARAGDDDRSGRVAQVLARLAARDHAVARLTIRLVDAPTEPGIAGIVRPVIIWPRGIEAAMSDAEIEAILAHEIAHATRRDNLNAAVHAIVQAAFWVHPLVWWIGGRLVDERERACDEAVIRSGRLPQVYAESILKTCARCLEAPTLCMAGVSGSSLSARIEAIMGPRVRPLTIGKRVLLAAAVVVVVATPVTVGALNAPPVSRGQRVVLRARRFDAATVTPSAETGPRQFIRTNRQGTFTATAMPLRGLVRFAFGVPDAQLVGPPWIDGARYDIEATGDAPDERGNTLATGGLGPSRAMLVTLLAERFNLAMHRETRTMEKSILRRAHAGPLGPGLTPSTLDCLAEAGRCGFRVGDGEMTAKRFPLSQLAATLANVTHRVVDDQTGLDGAFDLTVRWTPDKEPRDFAPLRQAMRDQLGLELESTSGPVDVLVIDRIDRLPN